MLALKPNKALGPDGVKPSVLKKCAEQLSGIMCEIFNMSLKECRGRGDDRGRGRGGGGDRGGGGWSTSRKGGLDIDDSVDGPSVNSSGYNSHGGASGRDVRGGSSGRGRGSGRGSHNAVKVVMQTLYMSPENQDMVKQTLQALQMDNAQVESGYDDSNEEFDEEEYDELDYRAEDQYWITDRTLLVQDVQVNNKNKAASSSAKYAPQESVYATRKLQRCGFSQDHCQEALQLTDGDVGAALEYLLNDLFNISLDVKNTYDGATESEDCSDKELLEAREDEKMALQSIYESAFEERIPNKCWALNLELPELAELVNTNFKPVAENNVNTLPYQVKKPCEFYFKGKCKFKGNCRFSHSQPGEDGGNTTDLSHPIYNKLREVEADKKPLFTLEIRFPEGSKYPQEAPLLAFSSLEENLPAHTLLNISQFLMSLARDSALDSLPCVFSLVSALEDKAKLEELLALPPPALSKPVIPVVQPSTSTQLEPCQTTLNGRTSVQDVQDKVAVKPKDKLSVLTDKQRPQSAQAFSPPQRRKDDVPRVSNPREIKKQNKVLLEEFKKKRTLKQYQTMQAARQHLPAWDKREKVTNLVEHNKVVVISGATGCGKTTQVPQFLLDEALNAGTDSFSRNIICTQPRRISAMAVAQRVADERAEKLGRSVGYQIRLESVMVRRLTLLVSLVGQG
ncbi:ATP-dependent RNA helicase DHX36 [Elysia marginata]|uniref:ATP-dependent RNA helicase DHX36 n=1 Tax=Elysia marginata TaxID=1093978 RepID=A0AAV4H602_9GAST|nr:ATP-dependent RNA helicase DHX36 [Elysia marginata]